MEIYIAYCGFLVAFYQFCTGIGFFRLNLGIISQKHILYTTFFMGVLSLSRYMVHINWINSHVSSFLINHQHLASIVNIIKLSHYFIYPVVFFLIYYLFYKSITPSKITFFNINKFYQSMYQIITSSNEKEIRNIIYEMSLNNNIVRVFNYYLLLTNENYEKKIISENEIGIFDNLLIHVSRKFGFCDTKKNHLIYMLDLFCDKSFLRCSISNMNFLYQLFNFIKDNPNKEIPKVRLLLSELIMCLVENEDSQLYKETKYSGLSLHPYLKNIISDVSFITSTYQPMNNIIGSIYLGEKNTPVYIDKYFELITTGLINYLRSGGGRFSQEFYNLLSESADIIQYVVCKDSGRFYFSYYQNINDIVKALLQHIDSEHICLSSPFDPTENYQFFNSDKSVIDAISCGVYKILEQLCARDRLEEIRLILQMTLFPREKGSKVIKYIQERVSFLMIRKIKKNIIDDGHFAPFISKAVIYTYGICEPEESTDIIHEFLMKTLKSYYLRFYNLYPSYALKILPEGVYIQNEELVYEFKDYRGCISKKTLKLMSYNTELVH